MQLHLDAGGGHYGDARSLAMMWTGIGLTGAGCAAAIVAIALDIDATATVDEIIRLYGCEASCPSEAAADLEAVDDQRATAIAFGVVGGLMIAAGVPLWIVGALAEDNRDPAWIPQLRIGASSATARWRF